MNITLYKKDTKGKTRYLKVYTYGEYLAQASGILGGAEVESSRMCYPKNVGRSNETTGIQQAEAEGNAIVKDKLTKGYFMTESEADGGEVILPMLAKDYNKEKDKIDWDNAYIQPKLDGMRCLALIKNGTVKLMSRQGKEITTCPHVVEVLKWFPDMILDGELYAHGYTFQENMTMVKKFRPGVTDELIKYNVYDIVDENKSFYDRFYPFMMMGLPITEQNVVVDVSTFVLDEEELEMRAALHVGAGYEGSIIRWGNAGYKKNGRSSNLLKYKEFLDTTATILDVEPMDARPTQGVLVCQLQKGSTEIFRASLKFSFEEREEILRNKDKYIGQTAEIRYFEDTDDGLPRFPVCVGFRLDK